MTSGLHIVGGLVLLAVGGEALVRGASRIALAAGLSPLVVGLTVVAFGTSAPELVVSGYAVLSGAPDVAVANAVGSNVFNVLFILGLCAVIAPLVIHDQIIRREVPILLAASALLTLFALDGRIGLAESLLLAVGIVAYTLSSVVAGRREGPAAAAGSPAGRRPRRLPWSRWAAAVGLTAAGVGGLVLGARFFVQGAVAVARDLGISEVVIGLTIVAAGTSLPEVATSVVATVRGGRDIAVGNVIGSNIFNILAIVGASGLLARGNLPVHPSLVSFDVPVMLAAAVATLPLFFTGRRLSRWEGAVFLGYYAAYTAYLVLRAAEHDALPAFAAVMWGFVLPITVVTAGVLAWRAARAGRRAPAPADPQ